LLTRLDISTEVRAFEGAERAHRLRPRSWCAALASGGLHLAILLLAVQVSGWVREETSAWFGPGTTVQFIDLKSARGVLFLPPEMAARADSSTAGSAARSGRSVGGAAERPSPAVRGSVAAAAPVGPRPPSAKPVGGAQISVSPRAAAPAGPGAVALVWEPEIAGLPPAVAGGLPAVIGDLEGSAPRSDEVRIVHPEKGVFAFVLTQTTPPEGAPPVFQGRPVYTVYLDVGTPEQWTLHYVSTEASGELKGNVLHLFALRPLEAPYPRVTVVPTDLSTRSGSHLLVSGILDVEGRLRDLQPAGDGDAGICARLIAFLERWSFRPARRAGLPGEVAVLLVVPD